LKELSTALFRVEQKRMREAKKTLKHSILVVDDEKELCARIKHELDKEGYQTAVAYDGVEGLDYFKNCRVDVVIADIRMPKMDGLEMLKACKESTDDFISIIITGHGDHETAIEALKLSVFSYLKKPISLEELVVSVEKCIDLLLLRRGLSARRRELEIETVLKEQYAKNLEKMIEEKTKALRESEEKFRVISAAACDAIITMDNEGKISYWNEAAEKIFGYSVQEALGKELHIFLAPLRYHKAYREGFSKFKMTGQGPVIGKPLELVAVKKNAMEVPIELSISAINLRGKWNAIGIVRDITERKKLEAQLLHAQKMEAVGVLTGGISHEFNNILQAIMSIGSLMQMKIKEGDPLRQYVIDLLASTDRAANLTRSLLAFGRKQPIYTMPADINDIVKKAVKFISMVIGEDIEVRTELSDEEMTVMADSRQIEQVLMNLITNARDAMPDGGVLTIQTKPIVIDEAFIKMHGYGKEGIYALISVTDTGIGMDKMTKGKIFDPFFTTKEVGKGTGLGLSIAYGIIKQHNGYINVYSELGKGTTFRIYLPLTEAMKEEAVHTKEEEAEKIEGTETVLIAEDEGHVRKFTKETLERFGYKVIEATDGDEALQKFKENEDRIQLLILDVIMPKRNGREVYDEIRKTKPDIKVIFVSGYPADVIHEKGIPEEGFNFIPKPIRPTDLLKIVREELDR
ncbi:MAG: hybrid sensor histidine kinase/response regulator, partial [Thermodesulfovibrio sp.]|nr:hybrid sensor histidine kinase/response regulator [Thermodesulfovibrio sp.]